jgi:hypothetical protein
MSAAQREGPVAPWPTDPAVIEAIEADFMLTVYEASQLARRRLLGLAPPPPPNLRAIRMLRRSRAREATR